MESIFPGVHGAPNIHPVFVHFPIALWLTALLFWVLALLRRRDELWPFGRWLLYLGTLGAVAAVTSGFIATEQMGHDAPGHDLVHVHRDIMLVASGFAVATVIAAFVWRRSTSTAVRWTQLGLLGVTAVVMTLGADRGADLVFRYGIGTAGEEAAAEPHDHDHGEEPHGHDVPAPPITERSARTEADDAGGAVDAAPEAAAPDVAPREGSAPAPTAPGPRQGGHDHHEHHDDEHRH